MTKNEFSIRGVYFPYTKQQNLVWPFWITFKDPYKAIIFGEKWIKIEGQYL